MDKLPQLREQRIWLHGVSKEILCAKAESPGFSYLVAVDIRQMHYRDVGGFRRFFQPFADLKAVHVGQFDVEKNEGRVVSSLRQRFLAGRGLTDHKSCMLQHSRDGIPLYIVVIYIQDDGIEARPALPDCLAQPDQQIASFDGLFNHGEIVTLGLCFCQRILGQDLGRRIKQYIAAWKVSNNFHCGFDAVHFRHLDIGQQHIGLELASDSNCRVAVESNSSTVTLLFKNIAQSGCDDHLVIDDKNLAATQLVQ
jgi:hypothetical protein